MIYIEKNVNQRWVRCKEVHVQDSKPSPCHLTWDISCEAVLTASEDWRQILECFCVLETMISY